MPHLSIVVIGAAATHGCKLNSFVTTSRNGLLATLLDRDGSYVKRRRTSRAHTDYDDPARGKMLGPTPCKPSISENAFMYCTCFFFLSIVKTWRE